MRILIFIFMFISLYFLACTQDEIKVEKTFSSLGGNGFNPKDYKSQEMFFRGDNLIYKLEFAYNGWQTYDSTSYKNNGLKLCEETYIADYNIEKKLFIGYVFKSVNCEEHVTHSYEGFNSINDKYNLSKIYLEDLIYLLELNPVQDNNRYNFLGGVIPSILMKYGISNREVLNSFSFKTSEEKDLIYEDKFYFEKYVVERRFKYEKKYLKKVYIQVLNKETKLTSLFEEEYILYN